jgi:uncharacterized lipoprotein YajG
VVHVVTTAQPLAHLKLVNLMVLLFSVTACARDDRVQLAVPPTFSTVVDAVVVAVVAAAVVVAAVVSDDAAVSDVEDDPHPTRRAAEQRVTAPSAIRREEVIFLTVGNAIGHRQKRHARAAYEFVLLAS